jgi:outer membrane protein
MRRRLARGLLLLVGAALFAGIDAAPVGAQATNKIGFVDLQRVLLESKKGKEALAKLQTDKDAKQREIDAQQKKIRQMEEDLEKQRSVLSETARRDRDKAIQNARRDLRRTVDDLNREFGDRERDLRERLVREVSAAVRDYAKKNGYVLIMEMRAGGVMYGNEDADLSEEIIAAYNAGGGPEKK